MVAHTRVSRYAGLVGAVVFLLSAVSAQADFYLFSRVRLGGYFGPLGNNPFNVTSDGTYAYIGGYSASSTPRSIGILKINMSDATDAIALAPGGTQTVNQFRYYGGLVVRNDVLYALLDRPDGTVTMTNVRAIDVNTGGLVTTFWGDFEDGEGIVYEPAALAVPALGGMAYDPGYGGQGDGLSLLGWGSGRRALVDTSDGTTIWDPGGGMIVADITGTCTVSDMSSWRDHVYADNGDMYMRRSNQVQGAIRSGLNAISGYKHLTDELNPGGTPKEGCGDGKPVAVEVEALVIGQHLGLIPATSAGTDEDLIIFNDRPDTFSSGNRSFADTIKIITTNGDLPSPPVALLERDGTPLNSNGAPDGVGLYDFHYDAAGDRLLVLDFANRNLLVFAGTQPCNSPLQDSDGDSDVDLSDYAEFAECLSGPGQPYPGGSPTDPTYCACVDNGRDGDVDLYDFLLFQEAFTGSQ